jgi:hypothetical protein
MYIYMVAYVHVYVVCECFVSIFPVMPPIGVWEIKPGNGNGKMDIRQPDQAVKQVSKTPCGRTRQHVHNRKHDLHM